MIFGRFHAGSGLGDQLHRYITTRTLAEKKGYGWGMWGATNFKGKDFMGIKYFSGETPPTKGFKYWNEKEVRENGVDIRSYDPEINFVEDNTIIDGSFEDFKYWGHNLSSISGWLQTESMTVPDDTVMIGFRGGEYATVPDLFLTDDYWIKALSMFPEGMKYQVHTDDAALAQHTLERCGLKGAEYIQEIGTNWRSMRYAKNAIIANSAFYIIPRLLRHNDHYHGGKTIAPRYWARRNIKQWARPACYYDAFTYV